MKEVERKLLKITKSKNLKEFLVKLIFGEDFNLPIRLLETKVEAQGKEVLDLANAIELIERYNAFEGKKLAEVVRYLHHKGLIMEIKFGREDSPVVYIKPPYWTNQASNSNTKKRGRKFTKKELEDMIKQIKFALSSLNPNELSVNEFNEVRAWWD
jgi:hypothetical protein